MVGHALSARREGPYGCRPAEQRDELAAADHSITSSARNRRAVGSSMPIVLAVFRFMANSYFVGCSIGRSAGFAPFNILAVYVANRRMFAERSEPYDISPPANT